MTGLARGLLERRGVRTPERTRPAHAHEGCTPKARPIRATEAARCTGHGLRGARACSARHGRRGIGARVDSPNLVQVRQVKGWWRCGPRCAPEPAGARTAPFPANLRRASAQGEALGQRVRGNACDGDDAVVGARDELPLLRHRNRRTRLHTPEHAHARFDPLIHQAICLGDAILPT